MSESQPTPPQSTPNTPPNPEQEPAFADELAKVFGSTVAGKLSPELIKHIENNADLRQAVVDFNGGKSSADVIEGSEALQALIDGFSGFEAKLAAAGAFGVDVAGDQSEPQPQPQGHDQGDDQPPTPGEPGERDREQPLTPEQIAFNTAADKYAELKAQPFYKRDKKAIKAAKEEYAKLASAYGREMVSEITDEPTRQGTFAGIQTAMWKDINARVAVIRKETKYGNAVEKLGKMHPAARFALMAGAGITVGSTLAVFGAVAGGVAGVAAVAGTATAAYKIGRAKMMVDVAGSEGNQNREKGKFDAIMAKFNQVTGIARLSKFGEKRLQKKYAKRKAEWEAGIDSQARAEGWTPEQVVVKKARLAAGIEDRTNKSRNRRALAVSLGTLAAGTVGSYLATDAIMDAYGHRNPVDGNGTDPDEDHQNPKPNEEPADAQPDKPKLSPEEMYIQSHQQEQDFLNTNGRVNNDFNNIPVDTLSDNPADKDQFPGYSALKEQFEKSPSQLAAQIRQIQEIEIAKGHSLDMLPEELRIKPGESQEAYIARIGDALHHNDELQGKLSEATLDYIKHNGQPLVDLKGSYSANYIVIENGKAVVKLDDYVESADPNDKILMLSETEGIRFPCGQPVELLKGQPPVFQPEYSAPAPQPEYSAPPTPVTENPIESPPVDTTPPVDTPPVEEPPIEEPPIEEEPPVEEEPPYAKGDAHPDIQGRDPNTTAGELQPPAPVERERETTLPGGRTIQDTVTNEPNSENGGQEGGTTTDVQDTSSNEQSGTGQGRSNTADQDRTGTVGER